MTDHDEQQTRDMPTIVMPAVEQDYEFTWGRWRIPAWLGFWMEDLQGVPWRVAATFAWFGFVVGVIMAAVAIVVGFYLALS